MTLGLMGKSPISWAFFAQMGGRSRTRTCIATFRASHPTVRRSWKIGTAGCPAVPRARSRKVATGFRKRSCSTKQISDESDSTQLNQTLVLERIEHVGAGHHHDERAQRMLNLYRAGVVGKHVGQAAVRLRRFVEVAADEVHSLLAQPGLHLVVADAALLADALAGRRVLDRAAARLGARHHAAGAVHGRVEARRR